MPKEHHWVTYPIPKDPRLAYPEFYLDEAKNNPEFLPEIRRLNPAVADRIEFLLSQRDGDQPMKYSMEKPSAPQTSPLPQAGTPVAGFTLVLPGEVLNIIAAALAELPFKLAAPIIQDLNRQVAAQSNKALN